MAVNILDYSDRELVLFGDLHGEFNILFDILQENQNIKKTTSEQKKSKLKKFLRYQSTSYLTNAVLVVCGDCGFGFNKPKYYEMQLARIQKILEEDNLILLWLRGNHDDPSYFTPENKMFAYDNIKFIPDYSVLKTTAGNTLCVGGAFSHDRVWRKKENERLNRFTRSFKRLIYWDNENVQENPEILSELKESGLNINSIITHTAPFVFLPKDTKIHMTDNVWYKEDKEISKDIIKEDKILHDLVTSLLENGHDITWWVFGHTHIGQQLTAKIDYNLNGETKTKEILLLNLGILQHRVEVEMTDSPERNPISLINGTISYTAIKNYLDVLFSKKEEKNVSVASSSFKNVYLRDTEEMFKPASVIDPFATLVQNAVINQFELRGRDLGEFEWLPVDYIEENE